MASTSRISGRDVLRCCVAIGVVFLCGVLIRDCVCSGLSRLYSLLAIVTSSVEPADRAVSLAPTDPEAHYTRALSLINLQRLDEAAVELRQATQLRPHHYYEWLDVGVTLDRLGDRAGGAAALRESIRLAPSFAQPHWQLGNLLFREERYPEAFEELRRGAKSNSNLTEGLIRLAWPAANGDVSTFVGLVQPNSKTSHLQLARFLAEQERGGEAVEQVRQSGEAATEDERDLLRQAISKLLAVQQYSDALEIWKLSHGSESGKTTIINGDFLNPILRDDPGFGWQLPTVRNVTVAIDTAGPAEGTRSLRVEFNGESPPPAQLVSQLVLLQPQTRYSLTFAARTDSLVTGGPPLVVVNATNTSPAKILGQSGPVAVGTTGWLSYQVDFATELDPAVTITLQRHQCSESPCPIFGKLWLGKFSLIKA